MPRIRGYPATVIPAQPEIKPESSPPPERSSQSPLRWGTGGALGSGWSDRSASTDPCPAPAGPARRDHRSSGTDAKVASPPRRGHHLPPVSHPHSHIIPRRASVSRQRCPTWKRCVTKHPQRTNIRAPLGMITLLGILILPRVDTPPGIPTYSS